VRLARDYRRQRVELTAEGRKMHAQLVEVQIASLNRMLRGFSRAEARTLEGC
jgi:DNA-binding MarR family transcriptional regulator